MTNRSPAQPVLSVRARLGECPVWDPVHHRLYFVDAYNRRVHQFDPATGRDRYFETDEVVPALALASNDRLLLALHDQLAYLHLETGRIERLLQMTFSDPTIRFNDGECDPQGRFWVGTVSNEPEQAALYRCDPDGSVHVMETGLTISNGLGWSPDGATFYLTDSYARRIYAYRFDGATGCISDRRVLVDLGDVVPEPDGLTIDRQGHLWSALWNGWCLVRFDANGQELARVPLPVQCPTSLAFGGPDLTDLYVTSASVGLTQTEIQRGYQAGDLFRVATDAVGIPTRPFGG